MGAAVGTVLFFIAMALVAGVIELGIDNLAKWVYRNKVNKDHNNV